MEFSGHQWRRPKVRRLSWPAMLAVVLVALVPYAALGTHDGGTHSGRAVAFQADASVADAVVVDVTACDTTGLPDAGTPSEECEVLNADLGDDPLVATASVLRGVTTGDGDTSQSTATINDLDLAFGETAVTPALLALTATVLESTATASCTAEGVDLQGDTTITDLAVELLGTAVDVVFDADGTFTTTVGTATLTIVADDRQRNIEPGAGGEYGEITVTALRVSLVDTATNTTIELVLSRAYADILCPAQEQPTDAPPTDAPPTDAPPTDAPATAAPATDAPPTAAPATDAPPRAAPATAAPATDAPPRAAPATDAPPRAAPATDMPDTASAMPGAQSSGEHGSLLFVLLLGSIVVASLILRPLRRNDRTSR